MPLTDQWQGFGGLPNFGDPSNIPTDLKGMFDFLAARAVPRYASIAARDAELASPVAGQVAWVDADNTMYVHQGGAWRVLWTRRRGVKVIATAVQGIPNGVSTPTRFDQIDGDLALDSTGMWSASDPTRVLIPVSGLYAINATFSYASAALEASRINRLMVNNIAVREWSSGSTRYYWVSAASHMRYLTAGSAVSIDHYHGTGGVTLNTHSQDYPSLEVVLLG
jgi:hypothetical protein